jgi:hypothetical protein
MSTLSTTPYAVFQEKAQILYRLKSELMLLQGANANKACRRIYQQTRAISHWYRITIIPFDIDPAVERASAFDPIYPPLEERLIFEINLCEVTDLTEHWEEVRDVMAALGNLFGRTLPNITEQAKAIVDAWKVAAQNEEQFTHLVTHPDEDTTPYFDPEALTRVETVWNSWKAEIARVTDIFPRTASYIHNERFLDATSQPASLLARVGGLQRLYDISETVSTPPCFCLIYQGEILTAADLLRRGPDHAPLSLGDLLAQGAKDSTHLLKSSLPITDSKEAATITRPDWGSGSESESESNSDGYSSPSI